MRLAVRLALLIAIFLLAGCRARPVAYRGSCAEQTHQFLDDIHSIVIDDLAPVIDAGFESDLNPGVIEQIEKLDARVSQMNTPACNPRTETVKDTLRLYMLETKNYFTTVAGRAVYGEGPVQAQLSKMNEAGAAFELAFADVLK